MVVAVAETETYTPEEYLAMEVESDLRHEYHNGEIIQMPGGTPAHSQIVVVINALLWLALRGKNFCIFTVDQRLWIPDRNIYTYPDVMVTSRPYELQSGRIDTVTNPILIVEVLSDSTKAYDRDEKFAAYRSIPTFQEYLLIDQSRCQVEQFTKQGENQWLFTEYRDRDAHMTLTSIQVEIPVAELYENVLLEGNVQPENS